MKEICKREDCTACQACYNVCKYNAIKMKMDKKGFFYPMISQELCRNCGACEKVCHINHKPEIKKKTSQKVYAMWSLENEVRFNSSSGGAFYEMARWIISECGVVFGAYWNNDLRVVHGFVDSSDKLKKLQKSKYVQSDINTTYKDVVAYLKKGIKVLFSGTPCQIAGLLNIVSPQLRVNLYTVDLLCFGVASPGLLEEYKKYVEKKHNKKISAIDFRTKHAGWHRYVMRVAFEDGSIVQKAPQSSLWLNDYMEGLSIRESCHSCRYNNTDRVGDITIGDYWKYSALNKNECDDDRGISCIIVNTEKGARLFSVIKEKSYISLRSIEDLMKKQKRAIGKKMLPDKHYDEFWDLYFTNGFYEASKKYLRQGEESAWKSARKYLVAVDWIALKQKGKNISEYLIKKNYKNIAIYGMGEFGTLLCNELEYEDINIEFTMDSEIQLPYNNIPVVSMQELSEKEIDAIIVTPIFAFDKIKMQLEREISCPIISLEELLKGE